MFNSVGMLFFVNAKVSELGPKGKARKSNGGFFIPKHTNKSLTTYCNIQLELLFMTSGSGLHVLSLRACARHRCWPKIAF